MAEVRKIVLIYNESAKSNRAKCIGGSKTTGTRQYSVELDDLVYPPRHKCTCILHEPAYQQVVQPWNVFDQRSVAPLATEVKWSSQPMCNVIFALR